jgi:CheY-like chemotaxis protein
MSSTDVLLVDDDAEFRAAARSLLATWGFTVVGEAASGEEALRAMATTGVDLVLLDVQLPDIDGFEVARRLRLAGQSPTVVLVSTREAIDYGRRVPDSGVAGFVTKARLSRAGLRAMLRDESED